MSVCIYKLYIIMYVCIDHIGLQALDKAKEAGRKERLLCKQRDQASLNEQINLDLTYSVSFLHIPCCVFATCK